MIEVSDYTVIDLEMTGLSPKTDRIIEIGAVKVRDGKIADTYAMLVNPEMKIPERVVELTGITDEMVKNGEELDKAVQGLIDFIGDDVIVGQNVQFDYSFLKQWSVNHKIHLELKAYDTLKLARKLLPAEQPKTLEALCSYFEIKRENAHRALDDTIETKELFDKLLELLQVSKKNGQFNSQEVRKMLEPRVLTYKAKRQTPATVHQVERLKQYMQEHDIEDNVEWAVLTRSEASRLQDKLYAKYGR